MTKKELYWQENGITDEEFFSQLQRNKSRMCCNFIWMTKDQKYKYSFEMMNSAFTAFNETYFYQLNKKDQKQVIESLNDLVKDLKKWSK